MKKLTENSVFAINLSKTLLYSLEYRMLYGLSQRFSYFVQPPSQEKNTELLKYMGEKVMKIHKQDAENIVAGFYPLEVVKPKSIRNHIKNLPYIFFDSLLISRRRKLNINKDLSDTPDVPDYLKRNYHFQTDGYFSKDSAKIYEHQVEVLFSGTAAPMRRMLIKLIKQNSHFNRPLRILELGAGVGTASFDFSKSFQFESYTLNDISKDYLDLAKERLSGKFEYVQCAAEDLTMEDESFDLVFSVYLFHELPKAVREKVLSESFRVLKKGGMVAICDSIQKDDDPKLNQVLEKFPVDYHEPFYKDYTLWNMQEGLEKVGFNSVVSDFKLLSKYWVAKK